MDKPKTFGLKLSEVRCCDNCGKQIAPFFQHIQIRKAMFNPANVNGVLGLMHIWGNNARALGLAETMVAGADEAVEVLDEPEATITLFICNECFLQEINLAAIEEKRADAENKQKTEVRHEG